MVTTESTNTDRSQPNGDPPGDDREAPDSDDPPASTASGVAQQPLDSDVETTGADADGEPDQPTDEPEEEPIPKDVCFDILKNERRRLVMHYLKEEETPVPLGELAEHIAALENDKPESALNSRERKRVYVGLYQCHLPRMDDADVVDFDQSRGTIELGENAEELYPYIQSGDDDGDAWAKRYLACSLAGGATIAVGTVVAPAVWMVTALTAAFVGTFVALSTIHVLSTSAESES